MKAKIKIEIWNGVDFTNKLLNTIYSPLFEIKTELCSVPTINAVPL
jgi:hypothetical protein